MRLNILMYLSVLCHLVDTHVFEVSVYVLIESRETTGAIPVACFGRAVKSLKHLLFAAQE